MARISILGVDVEYELLGEPNAPAVAITPGGRFSKDTPGIRELGQALAAGGRRVLLWDRPNCGASDISFDADGESDLHARTLLALIDALDLGPTALAAGSAGSRISLIAASREPDKVSHLALWWISGGVVSLITLANYYCCDYALAASAGGMPAVVALPGWAEQIARNPKNRDILLAQDPARFIQKMEQWASVYLPVADSPVPGMTPADFARLRMPTLLFQNGLSDISHTRATSDWVSRLIPHADLRDPPWPDQEWNQRMLSKTPDGKPGLFAGWPALAPAILEFTAIQ
ncbi:alpha/beta fold hydrolase [Caulobacter soli]|uniref:alpha/beta fold hydrolase n=1 Tax=Caulobacter soli TaxID=2708539 RepID=UPI0013ED4381|nr:alpha/beta hydrolase [Caulobacter soli]